ncbi:hypothetical protein EC1094_3959 [Escherichia coli]|nr:hypothetical protein EC1094_3959 [Escherichia coli]
MSELPFNEVNGVWKQLAAGYASTQGESFTGHGGSPVTVEEAERFFIYFDQKGPVKLVAKHNQAGMVSDVKKPLHFPEKPPIC